MKRREFIENVWHSMVAAYSRPGVDRICLSLQSCHDVDVTIALFFLLADRAGLAPSENDAVAMDTGIAEWREHVVRGLRAIRTWQKLRVGSPVEEKLRNDIKRLELEAERLQLARLCAHFNTLSDVDPEGGSAERYLRRKNVDKELLSAFLTI